MSIENIPTEDQVADLETVFASAGYVAVSHELSAADQADHAGSAEFGEVEDFEAR
jgi:hypothetical protein